MDNVAPKPVPRRSCAPGDRAHLDQPVSAGFNSRGNLTNGDGRVRVVGGWAQSIGAQQDAGLAQGAIESVDGIDGSRVRRHEVRRCAGEGEQQESHGEAPGQM